MEAKLKVIKNRAPDNESSIQKPVAKIDDQHPGAKKTYEKAVANGFYQRNQGGLQGKYDNVRQYWEDQITRYALHDFIEPLAVSKQYDLSRIRILDLGAGTGEGYEILTSLRKEKDNLASREIDVLPDEILGYYKGIDVSQAMVTEGQRIYEDNSKVEFIVGDLSKGLNVVNSDHPYDIYFSSYGSLSHLNDSEMQLLITDICNHFQDTCIFVVDLVGRYSFEWQPYWNKPGTDETNMRQYSMSYLYPPEMLDKIETERFPLRYWGSTEIDDLVEKIVLDTGCLVSKKQIRDRSVFVGRHMNTREYNPCAQPIRGAVNSLFEYNQRTDLKSLIFNYAPHKDYSKLNHFFDTFQMGWNAVVYAAIEALEHWNDEKWLKKKSSNYYNNIVQQAINTVCNVVRNVHWFRMGDPRANVIEPHLGYILRNLEMDFQQGLGAGHGLLCIYELKKDKNKKKKQS